MASDEVKDVEVFVTQVGARKFSRGVVEVVTDLQMAEMPFIFCVNDTMQPVDPAKCPPFAAAILSMRDRSTRKPGPGCT